VCRGKCGSKLFIFVVDAIINEYTIIEMIVELEIIILGLVGVLGCD
jgi:hypothetical protein